MTVEPADLSTPPEETSHVYTSTACQHGLHPQCRILCKYCMSTCTCACHVGHENVE